MELFAIDIARIFNFFLIVFTLSMLTWKYIVPDIRSMIVQKETGEKKLYTKQQTLEDLLFTLNNEVFAEQLLHEQLQQKIIAWKTIVEQRRIDKITHDESLQNKFQERAFEQTKRRITDAVQRKEIHDVVSLLITDVTMKFKKKENVEFFQNTIIYKIISQKTGNGL